MKATWVALIAAVTVLAHPTAASAGDPSADKAESTAEADKDAAPDEADGAGKDAGSDEADKDGSPDKADKADSADKADEDFGHGNQFGLRAAFVFGYRMVLRYDDSPLCDTFDPTAAEQKTFCGHGAPPALDFGLSFAPLDFIEPFVWGRFGLSESEKEYTDPLVIVGGGARIYTMSDSAFKIYVEPAFGLELEGSSVEGAPGYDTDMIFHLAAGPQIDIAQSFGLYADAGLTLGILRSLNSTLFIKAGAQFRLP